MSAILNVRNNDQVMEDVPTTFNPAQKYGEKKHGD